MQKTSDQPHESYYADNLTGLESDGGTMLVRLMMAYEALRAGRKWVTRIKDRAANCKTPADESEERVAIMALGAWAREGINVIKQGMQQKDVISKPLDPKLAGIWDEVRECRSPRVKLLVNMRNDHLFHFGQEAAQQAIRLIKSAGDFPIFQTSAEQERQGKQIASTYTWGMTALLSWVAVDGELSIASSRIRDATQLTRDVMELLDSLIADLVKRLQLVSDEGDPAASS